MYNSLKLYNNNSNYIKQINSKFVFLRIINSLKIFTMIYNNKKIIYKIYNSNISNSNNKIFLIVNKTEISYFQIIDETECIIL